MKSKKLITQNPNLITILIIVLLVIPTILPLLRPGFFPMHDDQQVIRLAELDESLKANHFPVRWVGRLGFGYGYPLFNFYPPFVYYLGEIYHLLTGFSYLWSIKLVFITAFLASALTMYYWSSHHFGRLAGLLSALFYSYIPYKAVDAYVRGALAELFSFVWLPLILLSIDRLANAIDSGKKKLKWGIILSLSFSALIITHSLIALPFAGITGLYILFRTLTFKSFDQKKKLIFYLLFFILFALSLSAFFWLPSLAEKKHTLVDSILLQERYTYSLHYAEPSQLWNSIWGYGGSAPPGEIDGFTLKIGKLHIMTSIVVSLASLIFLLKKPKKKEIKQKSLLLVACSLLLLLSTLMTTQYSSFIWDHLQPLQYIQFPWRFLTFIALFSSLLAGSSIWFAQRYLPQKNFVICYLIFVIFLLLPPNLKLFHPQSYLPDVNDAYYTSDDFAKWIISKTSFEFVPRDIQTKIEPSLNITQLAIEKDQIAKTFYSIEEGSPDILVLKDNPVTKQLTVNSPDPTVIRFNIFNFPGWVAYVNNQPHPIQDDNHLKLITIKLNPGQNQVILRFNNTITRTFANMVSLTSIVLLSGFLYLSYTHDQKQNKTRHKRS